MSFRSSSYSEKEFLADKVKMDHPEDTRINLSGSQTSIPPTVALVTVALAETSAAAVVVATAAAVSWLAACDSKLAPVSQQYKSILNEIDMRKLDSKK